MSDGGGMGYARPEYDPNADPGNFPLVWWSDRGGRNLCVEYAAWNDRFLCWGGDAPQADMACWGNVGAQSLRCIAGLGIFARPGAFRQTTEEAVLRYFRHEGFLRSLRPCPP